jgi:hypothetical protein
MAKILPTDREPPNPVRSACVAAARGEYEPFQIVVPAQNATHVTFTASALNCSTPRTCGRATVSTKNISLFRERYADVQRSGTRTCESKGCNRDDSWGNGSLCQHAFGSNGWCRIPDLLVPFKSVIDGSSPNGSKIPANDFSMTTAQNEIVWYEVLVPRGSRAAPPGRYTGAVRISASGLPTTTIPVTLTVWDFELPLKPTLHSEGETTDTLMTTKACTEILLQHKIMPGFMHRANSTARLWTPELVEKWGLTSNQPHGSSCVAPSTDTGAATCDQVELAGIMNDFPQLDRNIFYDTNEPKPGTWCSRSMRANVALFRSSFPKFKNAVTIYPTTSDPENGAGCADVWIPDATSWYTHHNTPAVQQAIARYATTGEEFWVYSNYPDNSWAPRSTVDHLATNARQLTGFANFASGARGVLYWLVDYWYHGYDRETRRPVPSQPWTQPYYYENEDRDVGFGDATYLVPADYVGLPQDCRVPTMRLKWAREGVEDYEYAVIASRSNLPWKSILSATDETMGCGGMPCPIAQDMKHWTKSGSALMNARVSLGQAIASRSASSPARQGRPTGRPEREQTGGKISR